MILYPSTLFSHHLSIPLVAFLPNWILLTNWSSSIISICPNLLATLCSAQLSLNTSSPSLSLFSIWFLHLTPHIFFRYLIFITYNFFSATAIHVSSSYSAALYGITPSCNHLFTFILIAQQLNTFMGDELGITIQNSS